MLNKDVNPISEVSSSAAWLDATPSQSKQTPLTSNVQTPIGERHVTHQSYRSSKGDGSRLGGGADNNHNGATKTNRIETSESEQSNMAKLSMTDGQLSRKNFQAQDARVAFETFDSSLEERRDEKLVFKYI